MDFCDKCGSDTYVCQKCGQILCSAENQPQWRPDITGHKSAGNVCPACIKKFNDTPKRIIKNMVQCRHCKDIIESTSIHDFKFCKCDTVAVDGGHSYLKRCFPDGNPENHYIELSEYKL